MAKKLYSNLDFQGMELLNVAEYTEDEILTMLGLSDNELDTLQSVIDDTQITTIKTHSSSKIYMDNQQLLQQAKDYADKQLAKMSNEYKVVNSTSEMTKKGTIYLLNNGTDFDRYIILDDGTCKQIGTMSIDLSDVYIKAEADSVFLSQADAMSKYATIMTTDEIKNDMGSLTNLKTDEKDSLVDAINELRSDLDIMASSLADAMNSLGSLVGGDA